MLRARSTPFRRAVAASSFAAGFAFANLVVALPLLALAEHRSSSFAAALVGANTLAFTAGGAAASLLHRPQSGLAVGLVAIALGDVVLLAVPVVPPVTLSAGAVVNGVGMGLFWAGTMGALGGQAGADGSPRRFVGQYVLFTVGGAAGALLTGAVAALLAALGASSRASLELSFLLGIACALAALPTVAAWLSTQPRSAGTRRLARPLHRVALQVPDLFLTGSAALFVALSPVVLAESFRFGPGAIGAISGGVAAAKIAGSLAAGRLGTKLRVARTTPAMLLLAAACVAGLAATGDRRLYVALLLLAVVFALGAWPVLVDGTMARVAPAERASFAVTWPMREYLVIAVATAAGGHLVRRGEQPSLLLAVAAGLLLAAAISAAALLRRPLVAPGAVEGALPHVVHHPNSAMRHDPTPQTARRT
jgi:hypothetical protein